MRLNIKTNQETGIKSMDESLMRILQTFWGGWTSNPINTLYKTTSVRGSIFKLFLMNFTTWKESVNNKVIQFMTLEIFQSLNNKDRDTHTKR
jgi:hypothetical protein